MYTTSNPIMKKLEIKIIKIREHHEQNLLSFSAQDNKIPVGSRSEAYIVITFKKRRIENHRACVEMETKIVSHYHDTFTMEIPSRRVDKKEREARILFEDGETPLDIEDFVRQAVPPIAMAIERDTEELLPWGRTITQLQILIQSDLASGVSQHILFFLSGLVRSSTLFTKLASDKTETNNDEDVTSFIDLMEATRPGATPPQ
jgi:hypothetical protein